MNQIQVSNTIVALVVGIILRKISDELPIPHRVSTDGLVFANAGLTPHLLAEIGPSEVMESISVTNQANTFAYLLVQIINRYPVQDQKRILAQVLSKSGISDQTLSDAGIQTPSQTPIAVSLQAQILAEILAEILGPMPISTQVQILSQIPVVLAVQEPDPLPDLIQTPTYILGPNPKQDRMYTIIKAQFLAQIFGQILSRIPIMTRAAILFQYFPQA